MLNLTGESFLNPILNKKILFFKNKSFQSLENAKGFIFLRIWILFVGLIIFFISTNFLFFLRVKRSNLFVLIKQTYDFNTIIFPIIAALLGIAGLIIWLKENRTKDVLVVSILSIIISLVCTSVRIYATHIEPNRLLLRKVVITTPKVDHPVRIVHISDIQSEKVGKHEKRAFALVESLKPDLILFTGDLLQPHYPATIDSELPKTIELFKTLKPPMGIYGVYGDVDNRIRRLPPEKLGNLKMLELSDVALSEGNTHMRIFGLPLKTSKGYEYKIVHEWFNKVSKDEFTIVLGHRPDYVLFVNDLPIDLCLAGHTHGGQIVIPFYGPVEILSKVPKSMASGFHKIGKTQINVSAGVGNEHAANLPAIRINCPPEITLIELLPLVR